ncbi:MAG: oxygenase MpaB family protein, partial [Pseudomonadales bacterium]|nr:oxygenase MpaB family protein [Pseudomonadales bacterium]
MRSPPNLAGREDWEDSKWGMALSQVDMVATYLGFCVVMLGGLRKMGVPVTPRESRAVMHLWKY